MKPTTLAAYRLLHDGILALAEIERAGMRVDMGRLDKAIRQITKRIDRLTEAMKEDEVWQVWKRRYGAKTNLGSRTQLASIIYDELKQEITSRTRIKKRPQANEESLEKVDLLFVQQYLQIERLKKLRSTYLVGIKREIVDGLVHPVFNLHLVRTYRSSCDSPNFQNIPIRDKEVGKIIRTCFVPRDGHVLVEIDFKALEVCIGACYHKDPTMLEYIADPAKDMHRDMASEIFLLPVDQVTKESRFAAKGNFVFAEFYGSYYAQCAPRLWADIQRFGLKTVDGVGLGRHLRAQGITGLGACESKQRPVPGTFEHHVQQVEQRFWGKRFKVYAQWKLDWFRRYQKAGGFVMKTGFRVDGPLSRNDAINYPVQGSAFHCLLWSLIQLVRWLRKQRMRSVIVGQIHDSIVADVHRDELDDFVAEARRVMAEDIRQHWSWICVPLTIEVEVGEDNWWDKKAMEV